MRGLLVGLVLAAPTAFPAHTPPLNDLADMLDATQEAELVSIVDDADFIDLEVLTVERLADFPVAGADDIESFARSVFTLWGVGDRVANDGVLIVVSRDDRVARIELGSRFARRYDPAMQSIMDEVMVPRFRAGRYGEGIVEGARRVVARLREPGLPTAPANEAPRVVDRPTGSGTADGDDGAPGGGPPWSAFVTLAASTTVAGGLVMWAHRARRCPRCRARCVALSEADDDVYLDDGQRCEEFLNSVDHTAWRCPACSDVHLTRRSRVFSRAKRCDACGYRTARSDKRTVAAATYSSSGTAVVTTTCQHRGCGHTSERRVTLPQLQHATTSSAAGFAGGSSGHGHSSGGGGGRSGGGGATGSW